jgi:hypothetical protein
MTRSVRIGALAAVVVLAAVCGQQAGDAWSAGWARSRSAPAASASAAASTGGGLAVPHPRLPSRLAAEPAPPPEPPAVDPGTLAQTRDLPRADDPALRTRLEALWTAVVEDRPDEALPFFFPKTAYVQLKDLGNAADDFDYRLVGYYELDVHAAHQLLSRDAPIAHLIGIEVPAGRAEWMWPGSEQNKVSYYRVYGARVVYSVDGKRHSFGVFSMLSWRGQWYAVHFGPWPRWERYGDVYDPR